VIAECGEFRIRRVVLDPGQRWRLRAGEGPRLVSVVSGSLGTVAEGAGSRSAVRLSRGETVLAPHAGAFTFAVDSASIVLVTEAFAA
jgi:mannose-6-phosphate isomerase